MKIIITAAGLGSRFKALGLKKPKYLIKVKNETIFYYALRSLNDFFHYHFIFLFLKDSFDKELILKEISKLGIKHFDIILVDHLTKGQAETVLLAKSFFQEDDAMLIYNIDTYIKSGNVLQKDLQKNCDGLIYVTKLQDQSTHWSFVLPEANSDSNTCKQVVEKKRISDYASIGLYYFKSFKQFENIILKNKTEIILNNKELYIAPIYQYMINEKANVCYHIIDIENFIPLGTPQEVEKFDLNFLSKN